MDIAQSTWCATYPHEGFKNEEDDITILCQKCLIFYNDQLQYDIRGGLGGARVDPGYLRRIRKKPQASL